MDFSSQGVCRLVKYMFLEAGAMQSNSYCRDEAPWAPLLLGPHCPLFARKFPESTASQVPAQQPLITCRHVPQSTALLACRLKHSQKLA